jgi:hypothetical protein
MIRAGAVTIGGTVLKTIGATTIGAKIALDGVATIGGKIAPMIGALTVCGMAKLKKKKTPKALIRKTWKKTVLMTMVATWRAIGPTIQMPRAVVELRVR